MVDVTSITEIFKNWLDKSLGSDFGMGDLTLAQRDGLESSVFCESFCREEICIQQVK